MRLLPVFLLLLLLCAPARAEQPMLLQVHPDRLVAETATGEKSFSIEVADDSYERQRGLMFRETMADDRGMLFVFQGSGQRGFWMQNTPMPLDLLFIGEDGRVRAIEHGEPFSTDSIAPPVETQFVLELKAGTAQKAGIEVGDRLRHPLIDAVADNG
ncbi:DUF192 domain-containing protein [Chelativorans sp. AA-79]|uniref:DUF192 domain-containing protein n=1 Tax=Chelativorans sp. AA-79 TaxID=3028735 RepID=UPI0023F79726|nr:DUF192 domain-containing protein [Chelativorans sp. AA-79]WEX07061.1 DUF192 domain-containing protein [Chelativorans sp. AA-79]